MTHLKLLATLLAGIIASTSVAADTELNPIHRAPLPD